jgi:hypothetical protein
VCTWSAQCLYVVRTYVQMYLNWHVHLVANPSLAQTVHMCNVGVCKCQLKLRINYQILEHEPYDGRWGSICPLNDIEIRNSFLFAYLSILFVAEIEWGRCVLCFAGIHLPQRSHYEKFMTLFVRVLCAWQQSKEWVIVTYLHLLTPSNFLKST